MKTESFFASSLKNRSWAAFLPLVLLLVKPSFATRAGDQGVGVMVGSPSGLSWKMWMDENVAIDGAVGAAGSDFDVHASFLWHDFSITKNSPGLADITAKGDLPLYIGAGPRILFRHKTEYGVRFPLGIGFLPHSTPWEFFLEVAPILRLTPSSGFNGDFAIGARYYFPAVRPRSN